MEQISKDEQLKQFAKSKLKNKIRSNMTAVIYTRVSTREQAEKNMSLETQLKYCNDYAKRNGYRVLEYFGGTYESAKNDERKEFMRMQKFIQNSKEPVSHILVYSADRFSRSGPNAIHIASELLKKGIRIMPVTQPVDTSTPEGEFQQSIQFMFSQYDNTNRKRKTIDGMVAKMQKGYLIGKAPIGYTQMRVDGEQKIIINEKGKLIRKAFIWKADKELTTAEITKRLGAEGLQISEKYLSKIFRNPFYCGFISNSLLDGELVEGRHEKLISEEIFLKTNDVLSANSHAYTHKKKNEELPLKQFLICDQCGTQWVGYLVKSKNIYYYKCNQKGCCCNKNAGLLHEDFAGVLNLFSFSPMFEKRIKDKLLKQYGELIAEEQSANRAIQTTLTAVRKKLSDLKERHALGTVELDVYQEYRGRYESSISETLKNYSEHGIEKSNLEKFIDYALKMSQNLGQMWVSGDYEDKLRLQELVFPDGIRYNHKKGDYRTEKMNSAFAQIALQAQVSGKKKGEKPNVKFDFSPWVARRGTKHPQQNNNKTS